MKWNTLDSLEHEALQDYTNLTEVALRTLSEPAQGLYIAESLKVLERALGAGHQPRSIITTPSGLISSRSSRNTTLNR